MAQEIERKFLVVNDLYKSMACRCEEIAQGYLSAEPERTVRVRIKGEKAYLTVKTRNNGCTRNEWEYEIPLADAREMLAACCGTTLSKTRHYISASEDGLVWEVDEFHATLEGLVVAEIELPAEETPFTKPAFIGDEVTGNPAYYNSALSKG